MPPVPKHSSWISRWPILLTAGLVIVVGVVFLVEFVVATEGVEEDPVATDNLTEATYMDVVNLLLVGADEVRGEALVNEELACHACHISGADEIAPGYRDLSDHALARAPLTLEAYIYESIVYPAAHIVAGYPNSMPQNYGQQLTERQLGDIIAYLLTQASS